MEIRKVKFTEIDNVLNVYQSCVEQHKKIGFNQWDSNYPNKEIVLTDIQKGWLYALCNDQKRIVGVISITKDEPKEYSGVSWEDTSTNYFIIHRLCVSENSLRKGYAKDLMEFAEQLAIGKNLKSIRLDTFSLNEGALSFYRRLDYREVGKVFFEKRKDSDYTCFEKLLNF